MNTLKRVLSYPLTSERTDVLMRFVSNGLFLGMFAVGCLAGVMGVYLSAASACFGLTEFDGELLGKVLGVTVGLYMVMLPLSVSLGRDACKVFEVR